ncbi:MAG: helix-turn-helix domain-containing protein [Candidatus Microthrix sp.]|nr:helix-turn-helix domain-containing protein [Candidatus Microthrix sp.]
MDEEQAKRLGAFLRARREELGWSSRRLAAECEMNDATIVRIENGQFAAPKPDKLSRITEALGLSLSDVFALADYAAPSDLPHFMPYLRTKVPGSTQHCGRGDRTLRSPAGQTTWCGPCWPGTRRRRIRRTRGAIRNERGNIMNHQRTPTRSACRTASRHPHQSDAPRRSAASG